MSLFNRKELGQLELLKKENQMLLDKVSELGIGLEKLENRNQQLLDKVADLEKEKQKLIDESGNSYMQLHNVEAQNEKRQLIESNCELENELEYSVAHIETLLLQKSELIEKYCIRDSFNDFLYINKSIPNISALVKDIIKNLKHILQLLKLADNLEMLRKIEMLLRNFERNRKLMRLLYQLDDVEVEDIGLIKTYNEYEKTIAKHDLNFVIQFLGNKEKKLV